MSQLEHHLSRWLDTAFPPTSYALDSRVNIHHPVLLGLNLILFSVGVIKVQVQDGFMTVENSFAEAWS